MHGPPSGQAIAVSAMDGGRLRGTEALEIGSEGDTQFDYEGADVPGLYRVVVLAGDTQYILQFYVLDLENPQNNPPRVRILD